MTVRVLYVTGWCRCGSTILGNLLDAVPGVVHVGELHYLWRNGVLRSGTNTQCGCGAELADCELWGKVLASLALDEAGAHEAMAGQAKLRTRHTVTRLAESRGLRRRPAAVRRSVDRLVESYRAIAGATGARVVVDSSKYPAEPAALLGRDDIDLRVLHLVRDPRASALSWATPKDYIPAMGVARSTSYWTGINAASELVTRAAPRSLRLRYEDFAAAPAAALRQVLRLCDVDEAPPVDEQGRAVLGVNHTVTGNPDRLRQGPVTIRPDERWRRSLPRHQRVLATAVASPLLWRHGYR